MKRYRNVVVKIGSNVITGDNGLPDLARMEHLVFQLAALQRQKVKVVLVSSGAVAYGRSVVNIRAKADPVSVRQQLAAVGQIKLINTYFELFAAHGITSAQVLVTKEDFRDRRHYLNMKNCVANLLENNIIPVVNENDVVSVTELMFTDNDELSGLIASMLDADALILLSSVDGLYDGPPGDAGSKVIPTIDNARMDFSFVSAEKSNFGRGGMITKSKMALKLAQMGITVHLANGKRDNILQSVLEQEGTGTTFVPIKSTSQVKRWVATSEGYAKGQVTVNEGAAKALCQPGKATSLLPVGMSAVTGNFEKGDVVKIVGEQNEFIGMGVARYNSEKARERIGVKNQPPFIHYDYFYMNPELL